jgi:hypothetical protein
MCACVCLCLPGRGERIRTSGPCVPNAVLYQAELLPDLGLQGPPLYTRAGRRATAWGGVPEAARPQIKSQARMGGLGVIDG